MWMKEEVRLMDLKKFLKTIFIFKHLKESDVLRIANDAKTIRLSKNNPLFTEGDQADSFYIVAHGKLSVFKLSPTGNEQVLHIMEHQDIIAESVIYGMDAYPANCKAISEATVIKIPKESFVKIIINSPENALQVMASYSAKLREFVTMIEYLSLNNVKERVVIYLIKNSQKVGDQYICHLSITKKKLASLLGTIPETLSRTLKKLKDDSIIKEENSKIIISDMENLRTSL